MTLKNICNMTLVKEMQLAYCFLGREAKVCCVNAKDSFMGPLSLLH